MFKLSLELFSVIADDMSKLYTDSASTTNEVDDLDPILVLKLGGAPVATTHDGTIQLDSDSGFGQIKLCDELSE